MQHHRGPSGCGQVRVRGHVRALERAYPTARHGPHVCGRTAVPCGGLQVGPNRKNTGARRGVQGNVPHDGQRPRGRRHCVPRVLLVRPAGCHHQAHHLQRDYETRTGACHSGAATAQHGRRARANRPPSAGYADRIQNHARTLEPSRFGFRAVGWALPNPRPAPHLRQPAGH